MKKRHEHTANGKETCIETYTYTYDHGERLVTVTHQLTVNGNTLPQVTLYSREYDEVGRLKANKLHGQESLKQNYGYNVRSWITSISGNNLDMELQYSYSDGIPRYNGNISYMMWRAGNETNYREYDFSYDGLDRLVAADYSGEGDYSTSYSYDKNGNITGLQRYNSSLVDNLTYTYNGNQLTKVEDATGNATGFTNGASQANEYTYDANGNLTKDSNKGIASITYNSLNLPQVVTFCNGNTITYLYTTDGRKLRTVHVINGTATTTTDYCGNVIYENGTQKLLLTEEGYINLNSPTTYYYYLKDHQGNNRVVVNSSGTVQEVNHYYPFGSTFATSNVQPYKYNGKELDTKAGLNWYDYGTRNYDAVLGRWHVVDPLSEKYYSWSSYTYCRNNPINRIDIEGKDDYMINNKGWISIKAQNRPQNHHSTFGKTANIQDAAKLFLFAADNSDVEWKLDVYKDQEEVTAIVITDHNEMSVENGQWAKKVTKTNGDKYIDIHSHPNKNGKQEAYQLTGCSDNDGTDLWNEKAWYIGFSSKKNEYTRLEINGNDRCSLLPYHYPQLLSYLFDEYNEFHIPRFILDGFEIVVDDKYEPEKNMNDYINNLTGTFYFSNPNDSFFNSTDSYFATISGMDTLRYHVKDTINRHLFIDSVSCTSFFKRLSDERKSLDEILRDLTYLFHNENGKWGKIQIPYYKLNY